MIETKVKLIVSVIDDSKLDKFTKLRKEIESKEKMLKSLTKEITDAISNGAITHPNSIYEAKMVDKDLRFSPAYKDLLLLKIGEDSFNKLISEEKEKFDKEVKKGTKKPKKELSIKKKETPDRK